MLQKHSNKKLFLGYKKIQFSKETKSSLITFKTAFLPNPLIKKKKDVPNTNLRPSSHLMWCIVRKSRFYSMKSSFPICGSTGHKRNRGIFWGVVAIGSTCPSLCLNPLCIQEKNFTSFNFSHFTLNTLGQV